MKIEILKPYGYCVGVSRAMDIALSTRKMYPNAKITVLGMLVHNNDALKELEKSNIKTLCIDGISLLEMIDSISTDTIVILTAHGHAKEIEDKLNQKHIKFIDATCPFVTQAMKEIKDAIEFGREVIYIGKDNHPEANAALSISHKVHLLNVNEEPNNLKLSKDNPLIISQTTFSKLDIDNQIKLIKKYFPNSLVHNGVCNASDSRQKALLSLDKNVELIYIVGGKSSNNTKTLFTLAKTNFINTKVLMIENEDEINKKDLLGLNYVAISSGASTPMHVVNKIKSKIEQLSDN